MADIQPQPTSPAERIAYAIAVLRGFGGDEINRNQAVALLRLWKDRAKLTTREHSAVVNTFPAAAVDAFRRLGGAS